MAAGAVFHVIGECNGYYYGQIYNTNGVGFVGGTKGRMFVRKEDVKMRMSAEGLALLARLEAPSPAPDGNTTHPANLKNYKTNSNGKITQVKNQDQYDGAVTVGYGLAVFPGNTSLRNYLSNKYGIETYGDNDVKLFDEWASAGDVVALLRDVAGIDPTPGTVVEDHSPRVWTMANGNGVTHLSQQQFDALLLMGILGSTNAQAAPLFWPATEKSDAQVVQALWDARTGNKYREC